MYDKKPLCLGHTLLPFNDGASSHEQDLSMHMIILSNIFYFTVNHKYIYYTIP